MVLPPKDGSDLARFARGLADVEASGRAWLVGPDGAQIDIPEELYGILRAAIDDVRSLNIAYLLRAGPLGHRTCDASIVECHDPELS